MLQGDRHRGTRGRKATSRRRPGRHGAGGDDEPSLRLLAARELRSRLPVLFIAGYPEAALEGAALFGPDTQLLTKPFTMEVLTGCIRHMMAQG